MSAPALAPTRPEPPAIQADLLAGVVLEVADLAATRAFYEPIFRTAPGDWHLSRRNLTYDFRPQVGNPWNAPRTKARLIREFERVSGVHVQI